MTADVSDVQDFLQQEQKWDVGRWYSKNATAVWLSHICGVSLDVLHYFTLMTCVETESF